MPILFDAHSHLPATPSTGPDQLRVVCGTCEADWDAILACAAADRTVLPMLGLHPWRLEEAGPAWPHRLESLLKSHRAGLGECGLDFAHRGANRATQEAAFRIQLRLAHDHRRPVAMHAVRAWGRLLDLLREEGVPSAGAMIHAFSGSRETAQVLQGMGIHLSFSGDLLNPDWPKRRESLLAVEADYLLLETDGSGDLLPVIEAAASLRGVPVADLAAQTWENGQRCFKELLA